MFLRRFERRSGKRRRTYWALVESVRTGRGSRQRVVAYLGELKRSEQSGWAELGRKLAGKQRPQRSLFDPPHYDEPSDDEPALVRLRGVRLERLRDFGDVWMALGLWRLLGLDTLLESLATAGRLEIRPVWHQKQDRVLAHILVCFLAYVLWKTLAQWMRRSGLGDAPRTVLEELAKIKSGDILLPTQTQQGYDSGAIRLRCVTEPDEAQKILLHRLGIALPRRLRRIDEVDPNVVEQTTPKCT